MFLTIEELKILKEQYLDELNKAKAKVEVINDMIKIAEDKIPLEDKTAESEVEETPVNYDTDC